MKRELAQRRHLPLSPIRVGSSPLNNEPVNFQDAWGLFYYDENGQHANPRPLTPEEIALHQAAGGGPVDYDKIVVYDRMPTVQEVRAAGAQSGVDMSGLSDKQIQDNIDASPAMSLPNGKVYAPADRNGKRPNATDEQTTALLVHEVEHQSQYQNLGGKDAYEKLVNEAQLDPYNNPKDDDPYTTPNKGYLEYDAQQVEDKANDLYNNGWTPPAATPPCNYK
jgi:hypothetical protein